MEVSILDDSSAINDSVNYYDSSGDVGGGGGGGLDQRDGDNGTGMDRINSNSTLGTGYVGPSDHPNLHDELKALDLSQVCLHEGYKP